MKKVFVAGATGGMGTALVNELVSRGIEVIAFARTKDNLQSKFGNIQLVQCISGDVLNYKEILHAVKGTDLIIHAVSFPYESWKDKHIPCLENLLNAAKSINSSFVMIDNIYAYGKTTYPINENSSKLPHTKKGKLRLQMEQIIENHDVPYIITHIPDLFGPSAVNTTLYSTLQSVVLDKNAYFLGRMDMKREFAYTLDVAKSVIELASNKKHYDQHWNIPGCLHISGNELQDFLRTHYHYSKNMKAATSKKIAFLSIFSTFMAEQKEMMYLTETPMILDGTRLEKALEYVPLSDGWDSLKETIKWMKDIELNQAIK